MIYDGYAKRTLYPRRKHVHLILKFVRRIMIVDEIMRPACRYSTRSVALVRFRLPPHLPRHRERRERNNLRQEEQQAARGFLMIEDAKRNPRNGGMAPSLGKISRPILHLCSVPEGDNERHGISSPC